jgi:3-hydroxyacyl-CoA dehydrogenase
MLAAGIETFYHYENGLKTGIYHPAEKKVKLFDQVEGVISLPKLTAGEKVVEKNDSASLIDLGDGIVCVEFHTKMNTFDTNIGEMIYKSLELAEDQFDGIVIGNQGQHFSAGANVFLIAMHAQQGDWDELESIVKGLQDMNMRLRYSPVPVVIAPFGYTLGGGAEVMMHCSRIVSSGFLVTGLVEAGTMGLLPAGGGTKEMVRRVVNHRIVMNDDYLLMEAKREARHMADAGYVPPYKEQVYAAGRDVLSTLHIGIYTFGEGKYISEHDALIGKKVAYVLTGGNISQPQWIDEQYFLDLEREGFMSLCGEPKTQERIWHFLQKGKPLRN